MLEQLVRFWKDALWLHLMLLGELRDDVVRELRDVLAAAAQRWYAHDALRDDLVELRREEAALRQALEVAVAGRDDAHVDVALDRLADAVCLARLERLRQSDGNRARHLLDLIEEERAARGKFQTSLMADIRSHDDAEELLLEDLRRRIAAAQRDEWASRARARLMDAMRHALLARASLTLNQHVVLVLRHAGGLRADTRERRALADHRVEAVLRRVARRVRDERPEVLDGHRDDDDGLDGAVCIALKRHDRRDVLVRLFRRDPRDLFIIGRHAVEALVDWRVLVIHDDVVEV